MSHADSRGPSLALAKRVCTRPPSRCLHHIIMEEISPCFVIVLGVIIQIVQYLSPGLRFLCVDLVLSHADSRGTSVALARRVCTRSPSLCLHHIIMDELSQQCLIALGMIRQLIQYLSPGLWLLCMDIGILGLKSIGLTRRRAFRMPSFRLFGMILMFPKLRSFKKVGFVVVLHGLKSFEVVALVIVST